MFWEASKSWLGVKRGEKREQWGTRWKWKGKEDELNFAGGMVGGWRLSRGDKRSKRDINSRGV